MRAALLEDDAEVASAVSAWLCAAGHDVVLYGDGNALLNDVRRETFDFFLLDWQVPGASGLDVLRALRAERESTAPVIFMTARDAEEDVVSVLAAGADDFLVKPIRRLELIARIEAVIRRTAPPRKAARLEAGAFVVDVGARLLTVDGKPADLTDKEFDLAAFLFARIDSLVSKGHIAQSVWGHNESVLSRTVDVHVSKLRRKLGLGPARGLRLSTIYGFGYRLERIPSDEPA